MYFVPKDWTERLTRGGRRQRGSSYYEEEVHSSRVKRWNFFLKIKMLSGNKQDKVLLQENWRKVKVYGYRTWNGLWLIKEEKKSIESMLRDPRMARKPGEQGSHKGQGQNQVRLELGWVEMCVLPFSSSLHIGPDLQAENWQWRVVQLHGSKLQEHSGSKLQEQSGEPLSWFHLQKFL